MSYTTINKPSDYFNTKLYTGTGSAGQAQTGVGFQPDLVWTKSRSNTYSHQWYDVIRGVTKRIQSNDTSEETTQANGLTSFDSDGFTVGDASGTGVNSATYASWNWKANGAGVANTDGTISSTVSANTTAGFSIVKWTGTGANATVGHGLGSAPKMIIAKNLDSSGASGEHWTVFHNSLDTNKNLYLNLSNAEDTPSPEIYRKGSFTNNVFAIGSHDRINKSGEAMIAYCFAEKQGFSKFGSYTGNGNTDGSFIYTGFKPAFLIVKNINAAEAWGMHDNKRPGLGNGNAPVGHFELQPNLSNAENSAGAAGQIDFLSNGFKLRTATNSLNVTQNYIYMAFASVPLVGTNGVTAKGR